MEIFKKEVKEWERRHSKKGRIGRWGRGSNNLQAEDEKRIKKEMS